MSVGQGRADLGVARAREVRAIALRPRLRLLGPRGDAAGPAHRVDLRIERAPGGGRDASLDRGDLEDTRPRVVAAGALRPAGEVRRAEQHARGAGRGARDPAEQVDEATLVGGVLEVRLERLVGAIGEHDEIGSLVPHLLGEVILVPSQRGEDLRLR